MGKLISVVIPTRDSEASIGPCLQSIERQTYRDFEIIVVDGNSSDRTREIALRKAKVMTSGARVSEARNLGFASARGEILVSIDSDMILDDGLLQDIAESMDGFGALIIPELGCGRGIVSSLKALEKECYVGDADIESARVFSREAFRAVGGYDGSLIFGEDRDLHVRLAERFPIGRTSARVLHDTSALSLAGDLKKSFRYGGSLARFSSKHPGDARSWFASRFLLRYRKTLLKDPIRASGLAVLKAAEYAAGAAGYIAAKAGARS